MWYFLPVPTRPPTPATRPLARRAAFVSTLLLVGAASCSDSPGVDERGPLAMEEGCQPLLASTRPDEVSRGWCLLPYPSDFHRVTRDGEPPRIVLPPAAKPRQRDGRLADIHEVVRMDGASLIPTIVATLPSDISRDGLPGILDDPLDSATSASPSLILDVESGALVPHYVDVIERGVDPEHAPIVLRPFSPLSPSRRYVVALKGVRLAGSADAPSDPSRLAPAPEGFRRLRDGVADPALEASRERFDGEVFAPLERAGVRRSELQLAWDFTTGSREAPRADMLRVRELALAWLASNTPAVTISSAEPGSDRIWRTVKGTVEAPLFLEDRAPGSALFRGADGAVAQNGTTTFEFTVNVPNSVRDQFEPGRALAFGHGFFGGTGELEGNGAKTIAEHLAAVEFGIDWWGMANEDVSGVLEALALFPEEAARFTDRVHQAMANWLVMLAAIRGPLASAPELTRPADGAGVVTGPSGESNGGQLVYDPSFIGYFGASQGHILGGTLAALAPELTRVVLNVGGGGFSHMMPRSANFGPFALFLDGTFKDKLITQAYIAMFQPALDRIDPVTYAGLVEARDEPPLQGDAPGRRVLLQIGLGDAQVPNEGSFLHARALGVRQTLPAPRRVFGLEPATDPTESALTLFDFGIDTSGTRDPAPLELNDVHEGVRVNAAALRQMDEFLRPDGVIRHPCDGPCDPE